MCGTDFGAKVKRIPPSKKFSSVRTYNESDAERKGKLFYNSECPLLASFPFSNVVLSPEVRFYIVIYHTFTLKGVTRRV